MRPSIVEYPQRGKDCCDGGIVGAVEGHFLGLAGVIGGGCEAVEDVA